MIRSAIVLAVTALCGCSSTPATDTTNMRYMDTPTASSRYTTSASVVPPLDAGRSVNDLDCAKPVDVKSNLKCK